MKMNLKNMKNPQLKGRDSKVVRLIRNSCPFITNFGHVWSDQTRVLPLNDELLKHCEVVDASLQSSAQSRSIEYFLNRFPCLLSQGRKDTVMEQFALYQTENVSACIQERVDQTWVKIGEIKDETGSFIFKELSQLMLSILTIPHSSAHCECVFSRVRKNRTEQQRSSLSDKTLEALLVMKSRPGEAGTRHYSEKTLKGLKSAYYQSLVNKT